MDKLHGFANLSIYTDFCRGLSYTDLQIFVCQARKWVPRNFLALFRQRGQELTFETLIHMYTNRVFPKQFEERHF